LNPGRNMSTNEFAAGQSGKGKVQAISSRKQFGDGIFIGLTVFFAFLMVAILVGLIFALYLDAAPAIQKFEFSFLSSQAWDPVTEQFGALPAIFGTLLSSLIALIIAIPISIGAAVFLAELAPHWLGKTGAFLIEMLAAIPSVIIGLWGLFVMVPVIRNPVETWLGTHLGFLPLFQGPPFGVGFLSAGVILAIMIIPIITAVSRDALQAVPLTQRESMLALGATRWEMISRVVLPYCRSGLIGGIILGLGRALGETMAVTMVIGNSYKLTDSLFSPGVTIASKIASEFSEASGDIYIGSLVELAIVLFAITLVVNIIARLLVWRLVSVKMTGE
jgi:phosphate transport system permease protein